MRSWWWLAGLALAGCDGGGPSTDDTDVTAVTLSGDVQPLFERNCTTVGCHGGPEGQTGLDLTAGVAYGDLVDVDAFQVPSMKLVAPGDPDASYLMAKLKGTHEAAGGGGDIMPPGFGLAQNDVDLVAAWITAGAQDD